VQETAQAADAIHTSETTTAAAARVTFDALAPLPRRVLRKDVPGAARLPPQNCFHITNDVIMANETGPLLVYTYRTRCWELRQFGFQPLNDMADSMLQKRTTFQRGTLLVLAAIVAALIATPWAEAQPQFGQGVSHPGQVAPPNPAEGAAYSAAISQPNPDARVSAIQQFLIQFPNSTLRQPAIAQMMIAKRQLNAPGATPPPQPMNSPANSPMMQPMNRPMMTPAAAAPSADTPASSPVIATQPVGTPRDSLLQHPPKPADIIAKPGSLAIKADNSSLSQILQQISKSTGMKVDGLSQDERIFGSYGPGDPREVLLTLLEGSGYNVLMVGNDKGTPRQLSLSQRTAGSTVAVAASTRSNHEQEDDEIEQEQPPPASEQPTVQTPSGNPDAPQQPKTPAEIQQELLRLRQQQQQQMPQPPPQ